VERVGRRLLALSLTLLGMALASASAHAGSLCNASPSPSGSNLCEWVEPALSPGIDGDSPFQRAPFELRMFATAGLDELAGGGIVLAGQHRAEDMAPPSDLLLALARSVSRDADTLAVGAR
jgi:hypothetical protein